MTDVKEVLDSNLRILVRKMDSKLMMIYNDDWYVGEKDRGL